MNADARLVRCLQAQTKAQAQVLGQPLRLTVLPVNPAHRFYERLGFVMTRENVLPTGMKWSGNVA